MGLQVWTIQEMFVELGYQEENNEWQSPAEWLQNDSDDPGWQPMTEDDIIQHVNSAGEVQCLSSGSDSEGSEVMRAISHSQPCATFCTVLKWMEAQPEIQPARLISVQHWRDLAATKRQENLKQQLISFFFI